jgi:hypothetical protein
MTRNNADFQSSALFHGTVHPFQIGDIIEPRNGNPAYATPRLEYAESHADRALNQYWEQAKRENPTYNKPGGKQYDEWEEENPPKVFQVEPIDEHEDTGTGEDKGNVKSTKGFRVIKQVK